MWQRFTERARRAVSFAQEEAVSRNQSQVGTEHLLLGLLNDGNNRKDDESLIIAEWRKKAEAEGIGFVDLDKYKPQPSAIAAVPAEIALQNHALPVRLDGNNLWAAFLEPKNTEILDAVRRAAQPAVSDVTIVPLLAVPRHLERELATAYGAAPSPETSASAESLNIAVHLLQLAGVTRTELRRALTEKMPLIAAPGEESPSNLQLSAQSKSVIDLAYDEARALNNNYIGTEHLLLGIVREPDGIGGAILREAGVGPEGIRANLRRLRERSEANNPLIRAVGSLLGLLRVPPAPQGREPIPNFAPQPAFALEMSDAEIVRVQGLLMRREAKAYAEAITGKARLELPHDTEVEVLDHDAPVAEHWRKVRLVSGVHAGKIVFVPLEFVRSVPGVGGEITGDAPLANAPENRPLKFESLLRAALTVNSDTFDLTADSPLILKNALTEGEIRAILDEIIAPDQREALERGEIIETWCVLPGPDYDRMEFFVEAYNIRGRLTARFRRA